MEWFLKVLRQYAQFEGRARRKEYWMFFLFNFIFGIVVSMLDNILGLNFSGINYGPLYILYGLFMFVPGIAVAVRRLHDIDKSGWMLFVALIPIVGGIWLLILLATEGTKGPNQYGSDPKEGSFVSNNDLLDN